MNMGEIPVEVTYTNSMSDPAGGPYRVTIRDQWGTETFRVTSKTIKRAGSFQQAVHNRMNARLQRMTSQN